MSGRGNSALFKSSYYSVRSLQNNIQPHSLKYIQPHSPSCPWLCCSYNFKIEWMPFFQHPNILQKLTIHKSPINVMAYQLYLNE